MSAFLRRPRHLPLTLLASLLPGLALADTLEIENNIVISATQTAHSELSAPASVSVVTREELEKRPVHTLADAIKYLPGTQISPASSYGRQEIKLRGMDSDYTLLLINGRRVNSREALTSNYANDFDLSSIPMAAIERIEVIRGPMSSLYGADALGGVVNVILRQPSGTPQAGIGYLYEHPTEGESGDSHRASGYLGGALVDNVLLGNLILESTDQTAWRSEQTVFPNTDATEKRQAGSALGALSWLVDEQQTVDLDMSYRSDDRKATWNNSGVSFPTNLQEMERWTLGLSHTGNWDALETRVRYYHEDVDLMDDSELMTNLRGGKGNVSQTNDTLDGQLSGLLGNHRLTAGGELRRTELAHSQNLGSEVRVDQQALYLQDEFSLGALDITLGGRWDDHDSFGGEFSPRVYGVYNLTSHWVIKGGAGKAFKAPSIYQLDDNYSVLACSGMCSLVGNPDLKPETATSYELGTLYQDDRLEAGVMFFANDIEDMIYTDSWRAGYRPSLMTYSNVDKARIRGYELQGRYALNPAIGLRANYTYADGENRDSGETLRNTPRHLANVGIDWQATAKLGANLDYQYTGSQLLYVSAARPNVASDAYHTLNLGARYQATPELALKAGINNLANEKRDDVARSVDNILMGRSLLVGLNYDL